NLTALVEGSAESRQASPLASPAAPVNSASKAGGKTPALDQYTVNLTQSAREGRIDPVLGREFEVRQMVDILTRRRQNNPILTGEAGVGKTAVVEGLALRIAQGDVPAVLKDVALHTLDLGLLQAGAGVKGEFENRLKGVIQEVKASANPIILFIDEAHTLVGAGGPAGMGDAANLIKPALARGELRTIAATTWAEYKKYFERDAALARRFQVVKVEEPDEATAVRIMAGLSPIMEQHHGVRVLEEAITASVRLSSRYLSGRQLPDKSVSLLDTACARVALSQSATPAAIEDCRRRIEAARHMAGLLRREQASRSVHAERLAELERESTAAGRELADLEARWKREGELVRELVALRGRLERAAGGDATGTATGEDLHALQERLERLEAERVALQGELPLVHERVDAQAVAEVVSNWTGIPVGRMVADQIRTVIGLEGLLGKRIVGQDHALRAIGQSIRTSRANLTDPRRPIGVFLLVGTSGVGKTETALALAELLYGGEQNLTVINMSEFKEEHKVSLLMGSPPGYVGYGEGGVLTEAVRRKPFSVVLLDEIEKAHPGVQDVFYQVFDKGSLRDGEGRDIDFRNTVILMTTNAGTRTIQSLAADPETLPDAEGLKEALRPELLEGFKPAFLGRVTVLPYFPLSEPVMRSIVDLKLARVSERVRDSYGATCTFDPAVGDTILARCREVESGARNIDHILSRTLLPELAAAFLARIAEGGTVRAVEASVDPSGGFRYSLHPVGEVRGGAPIGTGGGAGERTGSL
ncbi:MAG TPA: type VI secretion system ATPase TssH, partial [Thermoanaerobaculia bacterium]